MAVKDALLTDRVKVKQEEEAVKEILQEIQEEETLCSLCSIERIKKEKKGHVVVVMGKMLGEDH